MLLNHFNDPKVARVKDFGQLPGKIIYREIEELQGITLADYIKRHNNIQYNGPDRDLFPKPYAGPSMSPISKNEGIIHEQSRESDYPSHSEDNHISKSPMNNKTSD